MERVRGISPILHLDLDNFNSPEAEHSRYVLTSPRSLESCSRLGLKPIELLFKPLSEFIESHPEASLEEASVLFEEYEKSRRARLRVCQAERERIIQASKRAESSLKPFPSLEGPKLATRFARDSKSPDSNSDRVPSERRPFPHSFSLADLQRSPTTERHLTRLSEEIQHKLHITVPQKDRKIAALMLAKHEEQQFRVRQSAFEERHREEEQKREEARRVAAEQRRRQHLLRRIRQWQRDLEARRRLREEEEVVLAERRVRATLLQEERWRSLADEQQARRRRKLEAACRDASERKRYQEKLVRDRERDEEAVRARETQQARDKEREAVMSKRAREMKQHRRLQQDNRRELLRHRVLKREAAEQERADEELRRDVLERKLKRSVENHALLRETRVRETRERAAREEEQMRLAWLRAGRENQERLALKQTLVERCQVRVEQAVLQAHQRHLNRARRVRQENQEKELSHRQLRDRVLEEERAQWEERWKAAVEKEQRREKLQKERAEAQERSRRVAHASCYLRRRVREQTSRRTFDQMAREAELTAHLNHLDV